MEVLNLEGKVISWTPKHAPRENASGLHVAARNLIKTIWPTVFVCEETPVKLSWNTTLYFDFYIPLFNLAIEVDGQQHAAFNKYFHQSMASFIKQKQKDSQKNEFCEINKIFFVRLAAPYNEQEWTELLTNYAQ